MRPLHIIPLILGNSLHSIYLIVCTVCLRPPNEKSRRGTGRQIAADTHSLRPTCNVTNQARRLTKSAVTAPRLEVDILKSESNTWNNTNTSLLIFSLLSWRKLQKTNFIWTSSSSIYMSSSTSLIDSLTILTSALDLTADVRVKTNVKLTPIFKLR